MLRQLIISRLAHRVQMLVNNFLVLSAYFFDFTCCLYVSHLPTSSTRAIFPIFWPEVNLSAMSGYLAPSNIAETQFDDDETGIRRRAGQRRKLHSVLFFQRL